MNLDEEKRLLGDQYYEFKSIFQIESDQFLGTKIDITDIIFAVCKYGSVMASIPNINKILISNSIITKGICFFSCDGYLLESIDFSNIVGLKQKQEGKDRKEIKCFQFLDNETLLLLFSDFQFYILDPNKSNSYFTRYLPLKDQEIIIQAKAVQNGFCYYTLCGNQELKFYLIQNVKYPEKEIQFTNTSLKEIPKDWLFLTHNYEGQNILEIQLTHPTCGIISLSPQGQCTYYNNTSSNMKKIQLPNIKNIQLIDISANYQQIAYLEKTNNVYILHIVSNDYEASSYIQKQIDINVQDNKELSMVWCGNECVVIIMSGFLLMVEQNDQERIKIKEGFVVCKEIDGLRVVSRKKISFLRKIPQCYINVFNEFSNKPGARLVQNYNNIQNHIPIEDQDLRNNKEQLKEAVLDCIQSAFFILNQEEQELLLKAGSYGKNYLDQNAIDHNIFPEILKIIRIVYNMNKQKIKRMITCEQVKHLLKTPEKIYDILLRYNYHTLAFDICQDNSMKPKIFIHWAVQVIEKNKSTALSDEEIALKIKKQQKILPNSLKISYVEIAEQAIQCGKDKLALILIEQEPQIQKKIPILLKMGEQNTLDKDQFNKAFEYFKEAINQALLSKNSDLVYKTLNKIEECLQENDNLKYKIFNLRPEFTNHYKNLIFLYKLKKQITDQQLETYFDRNSLQLNKAIHYIEQSFLVEKQSIKDTYEYKCLLLQQAEKAFKSTNDENTNFNKQYVQEQINTIHFYYNEELNKQNNAKKKTINNILMKTMENKQQDMKQLTKLYNISDKRKYLLRIRNLIDKQEYDQIDLYMKQINKKKTIIPYELVSDILIKHNQKELAIKLIQNITDLEEQINLLLKIDEAKKAIAAVVHSDSKKKQELLGNIRCQILDPKIIEYIDQQCQLVK